MSDLPEHPHIVQARRRAKDLLKQARAGDPDALARLARVSAPVTLAGAQLALAREFGQPSWPALVREIEARTTAIPATVLQFLRSSVNANILQAARLLHENPELAESGFPAAVVLGDAARVEAELRRDPAVATRVDPATGWTALHLACASRFHLDPQRAPGLTDVVRLLVDAGANVDGESTGTRCWRPLECAVTSANSSRNNEPVVRLLLERGAPVRPEAVLASLYAAEGPWCLDLLARHATGTPEVFTDALVEAVSGSDRRAVEILLAAGADPDAPSADGVTARRQALSRADTAIVELFGGVGDDPVDRLLDAIGRGDADAARRVIADDPGLVARLGQADLETLVDAAERGDAPAVALMLDLGWPIDTRRFVIDDDGATALHTAAWAGAADVVALLLDRGADVAARDARWRSQPLGWALVGSGENPDSAPAPDWVETVMALLDAGAVLDGPVDLHQPKAPSRAVVDLLHSRALIDP